MYIGLLFTNPDGIRNNQLSDRRGDKRVILTCMGLKRYNEINKSDSITRIDNPILLPN